MQLQKWSVVIVMTFVLIVAGSAYYRTMAQPLGRPGAEQAVGFDILESESGDRFFAVLVTEEDGAMRVDVYDSGGVRSGGISLREAPAERPPIRVLPD